MWRGAEGQLPHRDSAQEHLTTATVAALAAAVAAEATAPPLATAVASKPTASEGVPCRRCRGDD